MESRISERRLILQRQGSVAPYNSVLYVLGVAIFCEVYACARIAGNGAVRNRCLGRNAHTSLFVVERRSVCSRSFAGNVKSSAGIFFNRAFTSRVVVSHTLAYKRYVVVYVFHVFGHINGTALRCVVICKEALFYAENTSFAVVAVYVYAAALAVGSCGMSPCYCKAVHNRWV